MIAPCRVARLGPRVVVRLAATLALLPALAAQCAVIELNPGPGGSGVGPLHAAFGRELYFRVHLDFRIQGGQQLVVARWQVRQDGQWSTRRETRSHAELWDAARAVAELHLQLTIVLAVRVSTGMEEPKVWSECSS